MLLHMTLALLAIVAGLILLVWSADRFVEGAASCSFHLGMPPLLIGMVVVGFGTSAPEMIVSAQAALAGNPGIALGNAYGSNIANIALILGITALISPIHVLSSILRKELPLVMAVTLLTVGLLWDLDISRMDAVILLAVFAAIMGWSIYSGMRGKGDAFGEETEKEIEEHKMPMRRSVIWMIIGLVLLIVSSKILVWGAIEVAQFFNISDMIIGLTVVAIGTSLPELAASVMAARKGEHDIALGNVLGSNLFNTLAVVGIAGAISPFYAPVETLWRDMPVMAGLTLLLFLLCYRFKKTGQGRINRKEGTFLLAIYVAYTAWLIVETIR